MASRCVIAKLFCLRFQMVDHDEQSFHPPTSLRDFYRYIRIDFHSHYGSEFYCPVSLLRVYGLTHLEEWKWDSKADRYEQLLIPAHALPRKPDAEPLSPTPTTVSAAVDAPPATQTFDPPAEPSSETQHARTGGDAQLPSDTTVPIPEPTLTPQDLRPDPGSTLLVDAESVLNVATDPPQSSVSHSTSDASQSTSVPTLQTTEITSSVTIRSPPPPLSQVTPIISLGTQALVPPPHVGGGESIYRTIMNRITILELNATLHARYAEEHTIGVRELLKRLTEELGRLEGVVR